MHKNGVDKPKDALSLTDEQAFEAAIKASLEESDNEIVDFDSESSLHSDQSFEAVPQATKPDVVDLQSPPAAIEEPPPEEDIEVPLEPAAGPGITRLQFSHRQFSSATAFPKDCYRWSALRFCSKHADC